MPMTTRLGTLLRAMFAAAALRLRRTSGVVVKTLSAFAHDAASDKAFQRAQLAVIFRRHETDRVADGVRASGATDAMHVILHVHREIVIHHMRDAVHVDAPRGDVRRHEHAHCARLEIF